MRALLGCLAAALVVTGCGPDHTRPARAMEADCKRVDPEHMPWRLWRCETGDSICYSTSSGVSCTPKEVRFR